MRKVLSLKKGCGWFGENHDCFMWIRKDHLQNIGEVASEPVPGRWRIAYEVRRTLIGKPHHTMKLRELISFLAGSVVKNMPAMQKTQVWSLGWEDPLEKEMATHTSILPWEIPWDKWSLVGYSPWGSQRLGHDFVTKKKKNQHMYIYIHAWITLQYIWN